ncbi:MAG: hypothetical protein ABI172_02610 [Ginsengibacter sp.]
MQKRKISISEEIIATANILQPQAIADTKKQLVLLINQLINSDFYALVQLLYRIDVSEKKLKEVLNNNLNNDSAPLIADLIIKRQLQKIESRKSVLKQKNEKDEEEKW